MKDKDPISIVILDFWSDKNRGDAAMQISLLDLLFDKYPESEISVIAAYGQNEFPKAKEEFDITSKYPVDLLGGLQSTYYLEEGGGEIYNKIRKARQLVAAISAFVFLLLIYLFEVENVKKLLPESRHSSLDKIENADVVVWNGRNIRDRPFITEPYHVFKLLFHPAVAILLQKRVICVGASLWHLNNPVSIIITNVVLNRLEYLTLREERSLTALRRTFNNRMDKVEVVPDLSFYSLEKILNQSPESQKVSVTSSPSEHVIGLTLMDWYDDGIESRNEYVDSMGAIIDHITTQYDARIVIVPQVTYDPEAADSIIDDVLAKADEAERVEIIEQEQSIDELMSIYAQLEFLIATRMHSAIFALCAGTPVLAIAYDHGAKWGILEMLGQSGQIINFPEVTEDVLISEFERSWGRKKELIERATENRENLANAIPKHIEEV